MQSAAPSAFGADALFSYHLSSFTTMTATDCCEGGVKMKRVKAACIQQTLVFVQKEDCGLSRNSILDTNRREFEHYKQNLERTHTRYRIISCD